MKMKTAGLELRRFSFNNVSEENHSAAFYFFLKADGIIPSDMSKVA